MSEFRHDIGNHLHIINQLIYNRNMTEFENYAKEVIKGLESGKNNISTGNPVIDMVLNFKFGEAGQQGIKVKHHIIIPENLDTDTYQLSVILTNALDNAIVAASKVDNQSRSISTNIKFDRNRIIIQISNPYKGEIERNQDGLIKSAKQVEGHGLGLANIREAVNSFHGYLNISLEDQVFKLFMILYVKEKLT